MLDFATRPPDSAKDCHTRREPALTPRPFILALIVLSAAVVPASAAIPGADDPKAYTEHDFLRQKLAFHRRMLVDAYKAKGNRNAKWDDAAVKFLEAVAVHSVYGRA